MIDMKKNVIILASILFFLLTACSEKVEPWKFNEGDQMLYKLSSASKKEQMGMKIESIESRFMNFVVLSTDGEKATFEVTFTRLTSNSSQPGVGEQIYDSNNEEDRKNPAKGGIVKAMVGKKFKLTMNSRGQILKVEDYDKIGDPVIAELKKSIGVAMGPGGEQQIEMFRSMYKNENAAKEFGSAFIAFPEGDLDEGVQWDETSSTTLPPFIKLRIKRNNILESIEGGIAKVKSTGTIKMEITDVKEGAEKNQDQITEMLKMMEISDGKSSGLAEFDLEKGMLKKRIDNQTMTIFFMGQKAPTTVTMTLELIEYKPAN